MKLETEAASFFRVVLTWREDTELNICCRYELCLVRLHKLDHFDIRYVNMKDLDTGKVRPIVHCNYTSWPDHGTPSTGIPLLQVGKHLTALFEATKVTT